MKQLDLEAIKTIDASAIFSVAEAARLLGMSTNGLRHAIVRGLIKAGRSGGRYFILGSEIQNRIKLPEDECPI